MKNYGENGFEKLVSELKLQSKKQLYIYGGGIGKKTAFFLQWAGIEYKGFLIDQPYFEKSEKTLCGHRVFCTEETIKKEKCNLIVAFAGCTQEKINSVKKNSLVENVYLLDFMGRCVLDSEIPRPLNQEWIKENETALDNFYNSLCDEKSRIALDDFLTQRINGNYTKDFVGDQYFPEDIISLQGEEVFVDCGAFQGESALDFAKRMENKGFKNYSVVSFEPDPENAKIMECNLSGLKSVQIEVCGVYSKSTTLSFQSGENASSCISEYGDIQVKVKSIDDVLDGKKATFIKMDVEGSELEALKGAENTIIKFKPKLAICIYHKKEDLIDIPKFLKEINPDYRFYVRNHHKTGTETVLYAV